MIQKTLLFSGIFVCMLLGSFIVLNGAHKFNAPRNPAAVRPAFDFTHLRGAALEMAVKERLITGLETYKDEKGFGIGLGHFAFSMDSGEKVLGCRAYQKISMSFEAEEMAISGEKPKMLVEGSCEISSDLSKINPLWIPIAKIFGERPGDGDFSDYDRPVHMTFSNVADEWPRKWVLIGMSIQGDRGNIEIDKYEVGRIMGRPVTINFEE